MEGRKHEKQRERKKLWRYGEKKRVMLMVLIDLREANHEMRQRFNKIVLVDINQLCDEISNAFLFWQIIIWFTISRAKNRSTDHANHSVSLAVLIQYVPRIYVMFPLNRRIVKSTGVVAKTAWSGAAYNLLLYVLASHVSLLTPQFFLLFV